MDDLKNISDSMYKIYSKAFNDISGDINSLHVFNMVQKLFNEEIKKDITTFENMKIYLKEFLDDISDIPTKYEKYLFYKINQDKFKLYISAQYFSLYGSLKEPNSSLLLFNIKKILESISQKNTILQNAHILTVENDLSFRWRELQDISYNKLTILLNETLNNDSNKKIMDILNEYAERNNKLGYTDFLNEITKHIDEVISQTNMYSAENISTEEMATTIEEIKQEIQKGNLSLEEYKNKKHQLDKLNMVFNEIKPKAIQKGIGPFKSFNVYYYNNGMVAIDKIEYGARLFIMPITTYKYIIENNIESLRVIGKMNGVKAFKHDE